MPRTINILSTKPIPAMPKNIAKLLLLSVAAAAALLLNSCNTVSGFGRDLQDASDAVQNS